MPTKKILVVDDLTEVCELMGRVLQGWGFDVLFAVNGAEAVDTATRQIPDLIFMDLQMPVMDGLEATRCLRAHPDTQHIPIVIWSANWPAGSIEQVSAAGSNERLQKPFELSTIRTVVDRYLVAGRSTA